MGKSKTAQRAARAAGKQVQLPPKTEKHAWFRNPAFHQFEGNKNCNHCGNYEEFHVLEGEGQEGRRNRLSTT